ncbi:transporter substrate-binding domain-containing protein [Endozoicomonas sp. SM1973]|uniref:Transporter substrate-binding domain-containing protein n=1 Tax=Spartinivicinus marinus TaxID=2994442 RepID=A0A853IBC1_9GAMM|nr:transporter substrate-binding domain-containing protein [Spartinivicinus marinus]MCX4028594.1 transporter substrate-binding domain-containing protein [Spartinivicinus marinus]NYZ67141.1 transporter substrate-binding domain-containing protein [Spartinivicinus marinus]
MVRLISALIIVFASSITTAHVNPTQLTVKHIQKADEYVLKLLNLALEKTRTTYGPYQLKGVSNGSTLGRRLKMLEQGYYDILHFGFSHERNKRFTAIEEPIFRGLKGYRLFLIHRNNINIFAKIKTLNQLKKNFTAGFGAHWADITTLKQNGIKVQEAVASHHLMGMLNAKRFDYFPRGIDEIWQNLRETNYSDITIETSLAFFYPYPIYFYVQKDNKSLANRIQRGLIAAKNDGTFKQLFLTYHSTYIKRANIQGRKIFHLQNSELSPAASSIDTSWWQ